MLLEVKSKKIKHYIDQGKPVLATLVAELEPHDIFR
jgi:hypothetical protein